MKKTLFLLIAIIAGAVAFQGFQCSSKNMTTAKVAYNNKDYPKAIDYLDKELAQNPNNAEAFAILADIYYQQKRIDLAADYAKKSFKYATTDELKRREQLMMQQIWIEAYNGGVQIFNSYTGTNNRIMLDSAFKMFDIGSDLRPHILDFYKFKGLISEAKGDTVKAMEYYSQFVQKMMPEIQIAKSKGFFIKMTRDKFLRAMEEKPINSIPKITEAYDTNYIDIFKVNGVELYAFSNANDDGIKELIYWDYDPATDIPNEEKTMLFPFSFDAFGALAQYYYQNRNLDSSFKYLKLLTDIDPNNEQANRSILSLYQEMGKSDLAITEAEALVKSDPGNKANWAQLGDLQQNLKKYDDAINSYNKALDIDPEYDVVLRNIGSAYKNKASIIQRQQQDKQDADKTYKPNPEEYFPILRKSAEFFGRALKSDKYGSDFLVMGELANIYMVLNNEPEVRKIARTLEGILPLIKNNELEKYYLTLLNIYGYTKESAKMQEVQTKLNSLK